MPARSRNPAVRPAGILFPYVPETQLFALLVFHSGNIRILQFLRVKRGYLHNRLCHRKNGMHESNPFQMTVQLVPDGRSHPAFGFAFLPVQKTGLAITRLSVSAISSCLSSGLDVMTVQLVPDGRSHPAFGFAFLPVQKTGLAITRLSVSAISSCLSSGLDVFGYICAQNLFSRVEFLFLSGSGNTNML